MVLPERGIAVLRYDRRPWAAGRDVPYAVQAEDLACGLEALAAEVGRVPTGLWGFSQGAWVAVMTAAARADVAFLVLVGCSAVSPARQMRYGTGEQLRHAGVGPECVADPAQLTICELDGTSHYPTLSAGHDLAAISPEYTARLTSWLDAVIPPAQ